MREDRHDNQHGEAAVLVLAAGAGTRMRSDTPKVLHTLAGRSMLAHALHAVAKVAPQHLVVVVGQDREQVAPAIAELAGELGRTIDIGGAGPTTRHRARRRLRPGRAAGGLQRHRRGHLRRCPAVGLRHTGRPDRHPQRRIGRRDRRDHHAAGSDRLRPHPVDPGPRGHGDRGGCRRDAVPAGHLRGQRGRVRLRHRGAALGAEPAAVPQRPAGALPDRRDLDRPPGRPDRACQAYRRQRAGRRGQRPGAACGVGCGAEPADRRRPSARRGDRSSTRPPRGSTST